MEVFLLLFYFAFLLRLGHVGPTGPLNLLKGRLSWFTGINFLDCVRPFI